MRVDARANRACGRESFRSSDQGTTIVELSLVIIAFFVLIVGLVDVGRAVWAYNSISSAATFATRYAIVHGDRATSPASATDLQAYVRDQLPGLSGVGVTTVWDPDNSQGSMVQVTVQYDYQPVITLFQPVTLRARSRMAISY